MPSRLLAALALGAALLAAPKAGAVVINFASTLNFADPANPFGLAVGDLVRGSIAFDPARAPANGFATLTPAADPTIRFHLALGATTLTQADVGPSGSLAVFLLDRAFEGFAFRGVEGEPFPGAGVTFPLLGVDLSAVFLGGGELTVSDRTRFVGLTPAPFVAGPAALVVPAPAAAPLLALGLAALLTIRRRA